MTLRGISRSQSKHLSTGITKDSFLASKPQEDIEDLDLKISLLESQIQTLLSQDSNQDSNQTTPVSTQDNLFAMQESALGDKKKTWNDKFNSSSVTFLTSQLLKTLDLVSISKEKVYKSFWDLPCKERSNKLWSPTKIDCVDSVLSCSKQFSSNARMGQSWFSIQTKRPQEKNCAMTSFQSSLYSAQDYTDSEVTLLGNNSSNPLPQPKMKSKRTKKNKIDENGQLKKEITVEKVPIIHLKTLKIRLFPTQEQKQQLHEYFQQFRWYYNASLAVLYKEYTKDQIESHNKFSETFIRDLVRKYKYTETPTETNGVIKKDFIKRENDEEKNAIPKPDWWTKVPSRIPRGAACKLTYALNATLSNQKNGNITDFKMKFKTKKDCVSMVHFEDSGFPKWIQDIKSTYWYRSKDHKRTNLSFKQISQGKTRGCEIHFDEHLDKYTLFYPIEYSWLPENDLRIENQNKYVVSDTKRIISLDPGLRKFLVGYDPSGSVTFFGEQAQQKIIPLLLELDQSKLTDKEKHVRWRRIKCMVQEMHWKIIHFLITHYDIILLPTFETSKMIQGNKLSKLSKRIMNMFSFYEFKLRLKFKCEMHHKQLIMVNESFTSKTCGCCGELNQGLGSSEVFECSSCQVKMDRDAQGARNILLRNLRLR